MARDMEVFRGISKNVLPFPKAPKTLDCQGEGYVMSALKGSVQILNPGIDLERLGAEQAKERRIKRAQEAWIEFRNAYAELVTAYAPDDPSDHAITYIKDMRGRS